MGLVSRFFEEEMIIGKGRGAGQPAGALREIGGNVAERFSMR
jgi:hypothetical protein